MPTRKSRHTPPRATLGQLPSDQPIYHGQRVDLVLRPVTTNSGKIITREVCLHPGAVIILPILEESPTTRIVLIKNRRHTVSQTLYELPAGTLEYATRVKNPRPGSPTEDPARCAARELTEETGYVAKKIIPFGWFYTSPGILTEKMYAFLARGLRPGQQDLEDNEQIQTETFTRQQILTLIRENLLVDAKSIATLLKYFADA